MGVVKKSKEQIKYEQTHGLGVYDYTPTDHERASYDYCINNDIRISPVASESGPRPRKWFVGVSTPDNFKKVYKSRFEYNNEQIWPEVFKACQFYYDKHLSK